MTVNDFKNLFLQNQIFIEDNLKENLQVEYISYNSKDIKSNTLFFCKGAHFKEDFLLDAIKKGAVAYVSEYEYNVDIPYIKVSDMRKCLSLSANYFYNESHKRLKVIGITGTKGKTTTSFIIRQILDDYLKNKNLRTGFSSSVAIYDGVYDGKNELTTPEPFELHKYFYNSAENNLPYFLMEVSSQALKYGRVSGVEFFIGCYLNIGIDHISSVEHKDFEDYFTSKMKMFKMCKNAIINLDSDHIDRVLEYAKSAEKVITFSTKNENADFYGYNIHKDESNIVFTVKCKDFDEEFALSIPGLFNVENALCAIAVASVLKIPMEFIKNGVYKARAEGRMELYETRDKKIACIVDYAHNRLSLQKLCQSTREEYPDRKIYIVVGSVGSKAISRRKDLGEISSMYAHKTFLTADDPAEESVLSICEEMAQYIKGDYEIIEDRGEAVMKALSSCKEKSVVLLAGKGNEKFQKVGQIKVPYLGDTYYAKKFIEEYNAKEE